MTELRYKLHSVLADLSLREIGANWKDTLSYKVRQKLSIRFQHIIPRQPLETIQIVIGSDTESDSALIVEQQGDEITGRAGVEKALNDMKVDFFRVLASQLGGPLIQELKILARMHDIELHIAPNAIQETEFTQFIQGGRMQSWRVTLKN